MPTWTPACLFDEIPDGRALAFEVDGLRIAIFRDGGGVFALLARCPHSNGPLDLGWVEDGEAVCALHRWRFRLATGRCSTVRGESVHRFESEVRQGRVWILC